MLPIYQQVFTVQNKVPYVIIINKIQYKYYKETKMKDIKLIALDVDGTMTCGEIMYIEDGDDWKELKVFNAKDGLSMKTAIKHGLELAIITGRHSVITKKRGEELGIKHVYQNVHNKIPVLLEICEDLGISPQEVAYIGDDINDLGIMGIVGFSACPKDAAEDILQVADYISKYPGGRGAVRQVIEMIMRVQNTWPVKN